MLNKALELRVNFVIAFGGALAIIFLIKAISAFLPTAYYFNFSKLMSGNAEPLIIESPSVTGKKLCEILDRYDIPRDSFSRPISCTPEFDYAFTPEQIDKIYGIALKSDQAIRDAYASVLKGAVLTPLSDDEIRNILSESKSVGSGYKAIFQAYATQLEEVAKQPTAVVNALYAGLVPEEKEKQPEGRASTEPGVKGGMTEELRRRIVQASQNVATALSGEVLSQSIPMIKKSAVDDIIKTAQTTGDGMGLRISYYYSDGTTAKLTEVMSREFKKLGIAAGWEVDQKALFNEINRFSWKNYVISILLRLTPVFLFAMALGWALGRSELLSIALAGGLAAFLLSWPLMLLWDRVVQTSWNDAKLFFFGLYAVYIVSFFVTARSAALLGIWVRELRIAGLATQTAQGSVQGIRVTWRELAFNVVLAVAVNGAVYAYNLFLPLSTSVVSQ
jgi:hypothetical protein